MGASLSGRERVLVRLPSWLGDFVMSEPLVRALDSTLERGRMTIVARAAHLELLEGRFRHARRVPVEREGRSARSSWRGHDVAFLCTGSFRSAWTAWRAGIARRVGFARDGRGWLLTDALTPALERGGTPLERSLAELAGSIGVFVRDLRPRIELEERWLAAARARRAGLDLAPDEPY